MRNKYKIAFLLMLFFSNLLLPKVFGVEPGLLADAKPSGLVTLDFQDTSLNDVLKVFSVQSGMNFIAATDLQAKAVTMYVDKVPVMEAINQLFKANNLVYELDAKSNIYIVKDADAAQQQTITRVFPLKYASVPSSQMETEKADYPSASSFGDQSSSSGGDSGGGSGGSSSSGSSKKSSGSDNKSGIAIAVQKLLSEKGIIVEDPRTNSLVITDTLRNMEKIAAAIAALDVPTTQVMLEVEMLDVSKNAIDRLGIKFTDSMSTSMFGAIVKGAIISSGFPIPENFYADKSVTKTFTSGSVDFSQTPWKLYFDFIKQNADGRILARPRILTLNNETAEIKITTDEAIGSISLQQGQGTSSSTTTSAERVQTGVSLRVTPQINAENNEITMFILPSVKDAAVSTFDSKYKDPEERATRSIVRVKDGETIILGGLIRKDRSETVTKVPILGDIPLLGKAFTHTYKDKDRERELLIFITPRIRKENVESELVKAKKAASMPQREQSGALAVHNPRQQLINEYLDQLDKKKKK